MTEMMAFNWERVDAVVEQMEDELTQARSEFITLCRMVSEWIGHLKKLIIDLDQGGRQRDEAIDDLGTWTEDRSIRVPTSACVDCDPDEWVEPFLEPIRMKEISALNEKDGPGWEDRQPKDSLLKRAQENLEELKQRAHRKFDSVLMSLTEAKSEANEHMQSQVDERERMKTDLRNVEESLKEFLKARLLHSSVQSSRPTKII